MMTTKSILIKKKYFFFPTNIKLWSAEKQWEIHIKDIRENNVKEKNRIADGIWGGEYEV